jgi:hypothetical protein
MRLTKKPPNNLTAGRKDEALQIFFMAKGLLRIGRKF